MSSKIEEAQSYLQILSKLPVFGVSCSHTAQTCTGQWTLSNTRSLMGSGTHIFLLHTAVVSTLHCWDWTTCSISQPEATLHWYSTESYWRSRLIFNEFSPLSYGGRLLQFVCIPGHYRPGCPVAYMTKAAILERSISIFRRSCGYHFLLTGSSEVFKFLSLQFFIAYVFVWIWLAWISGMFFLWFSY